MRAAILSVGTELMLGEIADTNARWLSQRLNEIGVDVLHHLAVGDNHGRVVESVRWLAQRVDVIVVGGGLGPTQDDLTRDALAEACDVDLVRDDAIAEWLYERFARAGRTMPPSNLRQADIPRGARVLAAVGSAPGFTLDLARDGGEVCVVYALPGVPYELQTMADRDALPDLARRAGSATTVTRTVRVAGTAESAVADLLADLVAELDETRVATVAYLARAHEIHVRVTAKAADREAAVAQTQPVVDRIVAALGAAVAGVDDDELEVVVGRLLRERGLTVAVAESCTAGAVAARLARVAGASDYLRGGVIAYAAEVKRDVLGVAADLIDGHGTVSEPVAAAMASGVRALLGADIGMAVTCVAGPTEQGRPVGTTVTALALPDSSVVTHAVVLPGDRTTVQARAATALLESLRRWLAGIV